MQHIKNIPLTSANNKIFGVDICLQPCTNKKPMVVYAHGFNGFKDWGNMDIVAEQFAAAGFVFVKFNFSHNGTSLSQPTEFVDLEAFGNNNYTKQLNDLSTVVNWLHTNDNPALLQINLQQFYLIGHSMGGGLAILYAATDKRIKKLITWASISECKTPWGSWSTQQMADWKTTGVAYYNNQRTQQQMPLYYQLYEDYEQHQQLLNIKNAITSLQIPILICHGSNDTSVNISNAYTLQQCQPTAALCIVESDHVFGRKHPWLGTEMPAPMKVIVQASIQFLLR
ncbi:alpha/beta hydrolase [Ferruginibacter yonginensis]|uniref:Alpha/beta hydrolase n=1 Tax=Ferruginibacter yonginensis TaxID=1310416 RepID=A0ABV8QS34_9BACT